MALVRCDPLREFDQMQTRLNRLFGDAAFQRAGDEAMSLSGLVARRRRAGDRRRVRHKFHKIEREYGRFLRRFMLPTNVDESKLQAEFKNGVLQVHLPKSAVAKPKAIDVRVG